MLNKLFEQKEILYFYSGRLQLDNFFRKFFYAVVFSSRRLLTLLKLISFMPHIRLIICYLYINKLCHAEVSADRTNLSPFTKDYRVLAFKCDWYVFVAREGTH